MAEIFAPDDKNVPREPKRGLLRALDNLAQLPEDFPDELDDPPPQIREGL
jgi:hypothetical protein